MCSIELLGTWPSCGMYHRTEVVAGLQDDIAVFVFA